MPRKMLKWVGAELSTPDPSTIIVVAFLGGTFGVGVIYGDAPFPRSAHAFTATRQYTLWLFLLAGQTALWAVLLIPISQAFRALLPFGRGHWVRISASTIALLLGLGLVAYASKTRERSYPLPYHELKLQTIAGVGFAIALVAAVAMLLIQMEARGLGRADLTTEGARTSTAEAICHLRSELQRLLAIEGLIIGAAVLATAGLRSAILAYATTIKTHPPTFPSSDVVIYGAAFSLLLALLWTPIYTQLGAVARTLCSATLVDESQEQWHMRLERRSEYEALVGLKMSATTSFRSGVAILAPLLSALIGLLLR